MYDVYEEKLKSLAHLEVEAKNFATFEEAYDRCVTDYRSGKLTKEKIDECWNWHMGTPNGKDIVNATLDNSKMLCNLLVDTAIDKKMDTITMCMSAIRLVEACKSEHPEAYKAAQDFFDQFMRVK